MGFRHPRERRLLGVRTATQTRLVKGCARGSTAAPRVPSRSDGEPAQSHLLQGCAESDHSQRRTHRGITIGAGTTSVQDTIGSTLTTQLRPSGGREKGLRSLPWPSSPYRQQLHRRLPYRPNETMTAVDTADDLIGPIVEPVRDDRAKGRGSKEPADPLASDFKIRRPWAACGGRLPGLRFLDGARVPPHSTGTPLALSRGSTGARDAARGAEQPAPRIHEGRIR